MLTTPMHHSLRSHEAVTVAQFLLKKESRQLRIIAAPLGRPYNSESNQSLNVDMSCGLMNTPAPKCDSLACFNARLDGCLIRPTSRRRLPLRVSSCRGIFRRSLAALHVVHSATVFEGLV